MMGVRQVVVQRQKNHKSKKHADGAQKMPNIVIVVETKQLALHIKGA